MAKDGGPLRDYTYDPFSNRARMTDHRKGSTTAYAYDAADRLTASEETTGEGRTRRTYEYDHRGNLTKELQEGIPVHSYAYNAMDRLAKAWSHTPDGAVQTETSYYYNGLGQRVGKSMYTAMPDRTAGERTIQNLPQTQPLRQGQTIGQPADSMAAAVREDYLPDLTRPYHNLLSVTRNDGSPAQTFYWDSNAAAMEENGTLHYYLQDEMGSPLRVSGYDSTDSMTDGNHGAIDTYLTYGYDEFGNDLARTTGKELEEAGIPSPYTMQGEGQPFGYTGYRYDTLGATYFAQAREYDPQTGRFHAQDVIAGNGAVPVTLNRYGYCWGNPLYFVDLNGLTPYIIYDMEEPGFVEYVEKLEMDRLEKLYGEAPILCPVSTIEDSDEFSFADVWINKIGYDEDGKEVDIDEISIIAHGDKQGIFLNDGYVEANYLEDYPKKVKVITISSCNAGNIGNESNIARTFLRTQEVEEVIAWDGITGVNSFWLFKGCDLYWDQTDFYNNEEKIPMNILGYEVRIFKRRPLGKLIYKLDENGEEIVEDEDGKRVYYECPN